MSCVRRIPSRVAVREGRVVRLKTCLGCGEEKIADPDPAASAFSAKTRHPDGCVKTYDPRCRPCAAALKRKQYYATPEDARRATHRRKYAKEKATDLVQRERRKRQKREADARWRAKNVERLREKERERSARRRSEDPVAVNELQRMYYRMRRERQGRPVQRNVPTVIDGTRARVETGPFRKWLLAYMEASGLGPVELAIRLHIQERRVRSVLAEAQERLELDTVDTALLHADREVDVDGVTIFGLDDLYPLEDD